MNEAKEEKLKKSQKNPDARQRYGRNCQRKIVFRPKHKEVRTYRGYWAIIQEEYNTRKHWL